MGYHPYQLPNATQFTNVLPDSGNCTVYDLVRLKAQMEVAGCNQRDHHNFRFEIISSSFNWSDWIYDYQST